MKRPPLDMEAAQFNARPGGLFKHVHNPAARPAVRKSAPDDVREREGKGHRRRGAHCHPMFPAEFSLLVRHLRTNQLPGIRASCQPMSLRSSAAILFHPTI